MILLFKILQFFLSPTGFISVLVLIGLIFLLKQEKVKARKIFMIVFLFFYCVFLITPVADLILLPLENQYQPVKEDEFNKADKIILLLGGKVEDTLRASEVLRIYVRKFQISNFKCQIIVSGTEPLNPEIDEAGGVERFLVERGISPEDIILENKSRNTFENAKNIKELIGAEPFFLVTSAYHMPRAIDVFKRMGMNPIPAPPDLKIEKYYNLLDFFPNLKNLEKINLAFREYFGILFYKALKYD